MPCEDNVTNEAAANIEESSKPNSRSRGRVQAVGEKLDSKPTVKSG